MIADGWRPDRLNPASGEDPEDAGCCYLYATGSRDPIISKIRTLTPDQAADHGTQRATHGLPTLDPPSQHAVRTRHRPQSVILPGRRTYRAQPLPDCHDTTTNPIS